MIAGISFVCFATSYLLGLALDLTRGVTRASALRWGSTFLVAAGLVAHTLFLLGRLQASWQIRGSLYANWGHWCLVIAWILVACDLTLRCLRPANPWGIFLLPLALAFILVAWQLPGDDVFVTPRSWYVLGIAHGLLLLAASVSVSIGFAGGSMYLLQARRLKLKVAGTRWPQLPSLEWLWCWTERSLVISVFCLISGLGGGFVLNHFGPQPMQAPIPWSEPLVWASLLLLLWIVTVAVFHAVYPPARLGNKVAYLTIASFIFFAILLWIVFFVPSVHTKERAEIHVSQRNRTIERLISTARSLACHCK